MKHALVPASKADIEQFEKTVFDMGKIPLEPPPVEYRHIAPDWAAVYSKGILGGYSCRKNNCDCLTQVSQKLDKIAIETSRNLH